MKTFEEYAKMFCETYKLNFFHLRALLYLNYNDKYQVSFAMSELEKLGVDCLAISGFMTFIRELKEDLK